MSPTERDISCAIDVPRKSGDCRREEQIATLYLFTPRKEVLPLAASRTDGH